MGWRKLFGSRSEAPVNEAAPPAREPASAARYAAVRERKREEVVAVAERLFAKSGIAAAASGPRIVEELCSFVPAGYRGGPQPGEAVVVYDVDGVYLRVGSAWDSDGQPARFAHVDEHGEEMVGGSENILTLADLGRSIESSTARRAELGARTNAEARAAELELRHRKAQKVWEGGEHSRQLDRRARIDRRPADPGDVPLPRVRQTPRSDPGWSLPGLRPPPPPEPSGASRPFAHSVAGVGSRSPTPAVPEGRR
jgi:hypothetical protein